MTTTRTPIGRTSKSKITPEAIEAFKRMEVANCKCTCPPVDWDGKYWESIENCPACEEWWAAHNVLHGLLGLKTWWWPAFEYPDATCPYPAGSHAARQWQRNRDARPEKFELYRALQEAAKG